MRVDFTHGLRIVPAAQGHCFCLRDAQAVGEAGEAVAEAVDADQREASVGAYSIDGFI